MTPKKLFGFFSAKEGMTPRKRTTTKMFTTIPVILTKAYFFGRFSCRSLAKGRVDSVSKNMIQHIHDMYVGCLSRPAASAKGALKNQRQNVNKMVVTRMERDNVLYKRLRSSSCEKRK